MKTKLLLLLLLANFSISTYGQRNLLSNGDFETWSESEPARWYVSFFSKISQSSTAQSGSSSAKMLISEQIMNYASSSFVPVQTNKTYRITMYHRIASGAISNISIRLYNSNNFELTRKDDLTSSSSEWRKIEFEYTNTVTEDFQIKIYASGNVNSEILIDNVSIININENPLETISIPDINFEKKLISLGIDSGIPDGKVLNINVDTVTELNLYNSSIANLTGIEAFTNLQSLDVSTNNLATIDVSQNKKISYLNVNNNKLTNLDLSLNINLYSVYADDNELATINVTKNTNLRNLMVNNNKLISLDISLNIFLTDLYCNKNNLTNLDISNNLNLESLDVSRNFLTSLDVIKHVNLDHLYCNNNQLTILNVDNNPALKNLSCESNFLDTINITNNLDLVFLNIGNNNLKEIDIQKHKKLVNFYCYKNQIRSLDLSQNTLLNSFACMENQLTSLDLSHNPELIWFYCGKNQITSLDISKNHKVNEVDCEYNPLTYLNLRNGNNTNFDLEMEFTTFKNNPYLTCILVDDAAYSTENWSEIKDAHASYSTTCTLGLETSVFEKVALYPNPTKGDVTITNLSLNKATVYNSTGQLIKSFTLDTANTNNTISLSGLPKGIYYVYLINQDAASAKKVIVE